MRKVVFLAQAKSGDTVRVSYTGKRGDGTQFDTSKGQDPLTGNHPLAGEDLTFDIELVEIV
ncbi:MAG: FKBP-type peptidyl-prolyl cis-trans isomerase [Candidatus Krumholzibacteriia bacterium]